MISVISKNITNSKLFDSKRGDSDNSFYELEKFFKKQHVSDTLEEYNRYKNKREMIEKMKRP